MKLQDQFVLQYSKHYCLVHCPFAQGLSNDTVFPFFETTAKYCSRKFLSETFLEYCRLYCSATSSDLKIYFLNLDDRERYDSENFLNYHQLQYGISHMYDDIMDCGIREPHIQPLYCCCKVTV